MKTSSPLPAALRFGISVRRVIGKIVPQGTRKQIHSLESQARSLLGLPVPIRSNDRRVLEKVIFRYLSRENKSQVVLFVGCDFHTHHYPRLLSCAEFWTLEPDAAKAQWGAQKHIEDKLENLHLHAKTLYFDVIICNGVFGWGLNDRESCEIAFNNCFNCLQPGGFLIVGWNDVPERRPFPLDELRALKRFSKWPFEPLHTWRYLTDTPNRHTFDFYQKTIPRHQVEQMTG